MRIYFIDGEISDKILEEQKFNNMTFDMIITEGMGYSETEYTFNIRKAEGFAGTILTNCVIALNNRYCWNEELNIPELYIWQEYLKQFIRVDRLTDRELQESDDLERMYRNCEFSELIIRNEYDHLFHFYKHISNSILVIAARYARYNINQISRVISNNTDKYKIMPGTSLCKNPYLVDKQTNHRKYIHFNDYIVLQPDEKVIIVPMKLFHQYYEEIL